MNELREEYMIFYICLMISSAVAYSLCLYPFFDMRMPALQGHFRLQNACNAEVSMPMHYSMPHPAGSFAIICIHLGRTHPLSHLYRGQEARLFGMFLPEKIQLAISFMQLLKWQIPSMTILERCWHNDCLIAVHNRKRLIPGLRRPSSVSVTVCCSYCPGT